MTARIYVGTYAKYNAGSIAGAWLDLEKYADASEFYKACAELHKDEDDPEFMMQDFEGFPKAFYDECNVPDELFEWLALDEDDRELLEAFQSNFYETRTIDEARECFFGQFDSDLDFAYNYIAETGFEIPPYIEPYFDYEAFARELMHDYWEADGYYFRND